MNATKSGMTTGLLIIPALFLVFACVGIAMLPAWLDGLIQARANNTAQVITAQGRAAIDYAIAGQIDAATRAVDSAVAAATWYPAILCGMLVVLAVALVLMVLDARREIRRLRIIESIITDELNKSEADDERNP